MQSAIPPSEIALGRFEEEKSLVAENQVFWSPPTIPR